MRALTVGSIAIGMAALCCGETRLSSSTYLGGFHDDEVRRVAVDFTGVVHVVGQTKSGNFPAENPLRFGGSEQRICSVGPPMFPFSYLCSAPGGYYSSIVPDGTRLIRLTYMEDVRDLAVDHTGNVYLGGSLEPRVLAATGGAWRTQPRLATRTGFIGRLRPEGDLDWVTYVDGDVTAIALDHASDAYAAGRTDTGGWTTGGAYQRKPKGMEDAFILKLNSSGNRALYGTSLGGSWRDSATRIGVDATGAVTVLGSTEATNLPVTGGVREGGGPWQFLAPVSPDGSGLTYLSYFGRASIADMADMASGDTWMAGAQGGSASIGRMNANSGQIAPEMVIRGSAAQAVALDSAENVYLGGWTQDGSFPTTADALQRFFRGGVADSTDVFRNALYTTTSDAFLMELSPTGRIISGTYIGNNNLHEAMALAVQMPGVVIIAGRTRSSDFPVSADALRGAYQEGACTTGAAGPSGPRDFHVLPWRCDDGCVMRLKINAAQAGLSLANTAGMQYSGVAPMRPPPVDGKLAPAPNSVPERQVRVWVARARKGTPFTINDGVVPVQVLYAGSAPALTAGVVQINVKLSVLTKTGGATPVLVEIGGYGVLEATIAV